jgi:hypothetical protein
MGTRRYATEIPAPLSPRMKVRLQRAVAQALINPVRGTPTMRRTVLVATSELRTGGFTDQQIATLFANLIEEVAYVRCVHSTSLVSGLPRWTELVDRIHEWTDLARSPQP